MISANITYDLGESPQLLLHLLAVDPRERISVRGALSHPWIRGEKIAETPAILAEVGAQVCGPSVSLWLHDYIL